MRGISSSSSSNLIDNSRERVTVQGLARNNHRSDDHFTGLEGQSQNFLIASASRRSNSYFSTRNKRAIAGSLDSEYAVVEDFSRGDSINLSSAIRNASAYSIRRTDYATAGIGYGVYQGNDLLAWISTEDESIRNILNRGNSALNNRSLFRYN